MSQMYFWKLLLYRKKDIDRSTLHSFKLLNADIAELRFLAKYAIKPRYCLLIVDLFTSKIYTYPIKKGHFRTILWSISKKRKPTQQIRLQTKQTKNFSKIERLIEWNNIIMFRTKTRGGKAFAAKQKIKELDKILLKSKRIENRSGLNQTN